MLETDKLEGSLRVSYPSVGSVGEMLIPVFSNFKSPLNSDVSLFPWGVYLKSLVSTVWPIWSKSFNFIFKSLEILSNKISLAFVKSVIVISFPLTKIL